MSFSGPLVWRSLTAQQLTSCKTCGPQRRVLLQQALKAFSNSA